MGNPTQTQLRKPTDPPDSFRFHPLCLLQGGLGRGPVGDQTSALTRPSPQENSDLTVSYDLRYLSVCFGGWMWVFFLTIYFLLARSWSWGSSIKRSLHPLFFATGRGGCSHPLKCLYQYSYSLRGCIYTFSPQGVCGIHHTPLQR